MRKKNFTSLIFLLSLFVTILSFQQQSSTRILTIASINYEDSSNDSMNPMVTTDRRTTLTLKLEFIGFNQELINETAIKEDLFDVYKHSNTKPLPWIDFEFEFNYASEGVRQDLDDYIVSIADDGVGTGYEINLTLLEEDLLSGERNDIFIPRDGMSIDANLVNEYINDNLFTAPAADAPGYSFYLMNFSNFDSPDHSSEHWYDTYNTDLDGNTTTAWWYSGYRNIEKRAAMGWGGDYRFCYLDVSSRSWYLDYVVNAWYGLGGAGSQLYYTYPDLDNLTQTFDPTTEPGNIKLNEYLAEWINSYLGNVFSGPVYSTLPTSQSVSMQVLVLNNLTVNGYPEENLTWCISEYRMLEQLELDFPWIDWSIEVDWIELSDRPDFFNYIQENIEEDVDGRYLEVSDGFFYELQNELNDNFDLSAAEVVLPCYFFLTDDISFKWGGTSFAGLGGMGWEILLGTQYSLFDNITSLEPKRGMSTVMIHELGHSLGLPHPHSQSFGWGSSFVEEVMSYFSTYSGFSSFYKDAIGRAHTDANYEYALTELNLAMVYYNASYIDTEKPVVLEEMVAEIQGNLLAIQEFYSQMDYNASASLAFETRELIQTLYDYIQDPPTPTSSTSGYGLVAVLVIIPIFYGFTKVRTRVKSKKN